MIDISEFSDKDEKLNEQIEGIKEETKESMDEWMENVWKEFDWTSRKNPKASDALALIQEKMRPYEDELAELQKNHNGDNERAIELQEKLVLLKNKIKAVYQIYKK